jgi:hypothetical protein
MSVAEAADSRSVSQTLGLSETELEEARRQLVQLEERLVQVQVDLTFWSPRPLLGNDARPAPCFTLILFI